MTTSENLIPNTYNDLKDAFKVAVQIHRASIICKESSGQWKILIINNRYNLLEDLKNIDLNKNGGMVHINDNYGKVQRTKVQLNDENLLFFAKIIGSYDALENPLTANLNDLSFRIRDIISEQTNPISPTTIQEQRQRSGVFNLIPLAFFCYFKSFYPNGLKIEQDVGIDCYNRFFTYITVKDRQGLDCIEPLFRKAKKSLDEVSSHLAKNKYVEIKLELKVKVLERVKYQMFKLPTQDSLMQMASPLGKSILRDLNNYDLVDVIYL